MPRKSCQDLINELRLSMGFSKRMTTILGRTFLIKMRDPMVLMTQISSAIMMGIIFGVLYFKTYEKELEFAMLDTQMAVTMTVIMIAWLPYDVVLTFPKERQIFLRERRAGLYSSFEFYLARILADMPFHVISAIIFAAVVYLMAGLQCGLHLFILLNIYGILVGAAMMQAIGAVSRTFEEANILMMLVLMMSMMMSTGFVREVPKWLLWAREISVMGLLADIALYLEFKDLDDKFLALGTPEEILQHYGVRVKNDSDMWYALLTLFAILVACRLITYLAVKFMHTGRSWKENCRD